MGYILPDWMLYGFFGLLALVGIVGVMMVRRKLSNPDQMRFFAWEYEPSGMIPKVFELDPKELGPSHFTIHEGEK